jgi:hypothetical protein
MRFAGAFLLAACSVAGAQNGSVEGQVTNTVTGEPVRKAQVMLRRAEPRPQAPLIATTDAGGRYILVNVEAGRYMLTADRNGFVRADSGGRGTARSAATISVSAGEQLKGMNLKLTPHGVITGRVLDEDGEPVVNANIQALRYEFVRGKRRLVPGGGVTTNDLGEYRIFGLAPGRYYLSARRFGIHQVLTAAAVGAGAVSTPEPGPEEAYVPTYYPRTNDPAAATPLTLGPGDVARGIDLQLMRAQTVRISGRVVNNTGMTNRHIMVDLRPRQSAGAAQRNSTSARNTDGYFELRGVAPGSYMLAAALFVDRTFYSARAPIDVGAVNIEDVQLQLAPGADLKGMLRVEGDAALPPNLRISLTPREEGVSFGGPPQGVGVKEDGSFVIANVAADEFTLNLRGLPEGFFMKQVRLGERDVTYQGLDLSQGAAGVVQILVSSQGAEVNGSVTDQDGNPVAGAQVVLVPEGKRREVMDLYRASPAGDNGAYQIHGVPPGDYRLFAWRQIEPGAWMDPEFLAPIESRGDKISVSEGGRETRQLRILP